MKRIASLLLCLAIAPVYSQPRDPNGLTQRTPEEWKEYLQKRAEASNHTGHDHTSVKDLVSATCRVQAGLQEDGLACALQASFMAGKGFEIRMIYTDILLLETLIINDNWKYGVQGLLKTIRSLTTVAVSLFTI